MKKITKSLLLGSLFFSMLVNSQSLTPVKDKVQYGADMVLSWKVSVTPEPNVLKKAVKRFIKDRYDIKLKGLGLFSNKDVLSAEEVTLAGISSKRINLYASVMDNDGQSELRLFASNGGYDYFDEEDVSEFQGVRTVLVNFLNSYLPKYYNEQLEDATDRYEDIVKKGENLRDRVASNNEEISDLQKENEELTQNIAENKESLIQSKDELVKRQEQLDQIKKLLGKIEK